MVKFMKTLAVIFLVCGFIGAIALGIAYPTISVSYYARESFNWSIFFGSLFGSVVIFGLFYSIGYGLELLETVVSNTTQINSNISALKENKIHPVEAHEVAGMSNNPSESELTKEKAYELKKQTHIKCPSCGTWNKKDRWMCYQCGKSLTPPITQK